MMGRRYLVPILLFIMFMVPVTGVHSAGEARSHWTFNETTGMLIDATGSGMDGQLHGDIERGVSGVNDSSAYRFDGEDDWVSFDDGTYLDPAETFSLEVWFQPDTVTPDGVMRIFQDSNSATYGMYINTEGNLVFFTDTRDDGGSWRGIGFSLNTTDWYHVVGTYNGSAMRVYVGGELVESTAQSGTVDSDDTPPAIGAHHAPQQFFDGRIDDIRVYHTALNRTVVNEHHESPPGWHPASDQTADNGSGETNETEGENGTEDDTPEDTDTGNETSDGTSDNDTMTDDETSDGGSDDPLFTGGNGTDETSDGTINGTDDGDAGSNGTSDTVSPDNDTEPPDDERPSSTGVSLQFRPDSIGMTVLQGQRQRRTVAVTNTGDQTATVSVAVEGISGVRVGQRRFTVGPGEVFRIPLLVEPSDGMNGTYRGTVRFSGNGFAYVVDTRVTVTAEDAYDGIDLTVDPISEVVQPGSVRFDAMAVVSNLGEDRTPYRLSSVLMDDGGEVVYEKGFNASVDDFEETDLSLNREVTPGNYSLIIRASSGGEVVEYSKTFTVPEETIEEDGGTSMSLLAIVLAVFIVGVVAVIAAHEKTDLLDGRWRPGG